jgi:hypothetical protein
MVQLKIGGLVLVPEVRERTFEILGLAGRGPLSIEGHLGLRPQKTMAGPTVR